MSAPPVEASTTSVPGPQAPPPSGPGIPPGRLAFGVFLLLLGAGWLVEVLGIADIRWQTVLAAAVATIGAILLLTARRGRTDGLIGLGIILSVALVLVASVPGVPLTGGVGDRDVRVTSASQLEPSYELGAGTLTLDLRELTLPAGTTAIAAHVGAGELRIRVPQDAAVEATARTGAGEVSVLGEHSEGLSPSLAVRSPGDGGTLVLDLTVGLGTIEVTR